MIKELFSFQGRLRRSEYAKNCLAAFVILLGILGLLYFLMWLMGNSNFLISIFLSPSFLILIWFFLAQRIKRIHDTGSSAWLLLLLGIPYFNIFFEIYIWLAKGTNGANKYGQDPRIKKYQH